MKVAIIYNKDLSGVINVFGMQNKEIYDPKTVKLVVDALESGGHNVEVIDGNMKVIEQLQQFMPKVIEGEQMGMVFNMAYGIQGESRYTHIPSMLEMLGIPYVGSGPSGHALALDKVITKILLQKNNIPTPAFWVFSSGNENMSEVQFPVIVKPKMESVSFGLRVVHNQEDLCEAVEYIVKEFEQQALVEQFIRGREFAVGLIGNKPVETLPILEIDLENDPEAIQTEDHKRSKPRRKICPAMLDNSTAEEMRKQCIAAFNALQLRDFSRVDIRMDEKGNIYILEINSMASLGKTGSYVNAASVAGYNYKALVNRMLEVAVARYFDSQMEPSETSGMIRKVPAYIRIRGFLRSRQETLEKLLLKAVNINTHVRNIEGVNELGNLMRKEMGKLGFSHEVIPQVEVGNILFFTNSFDEEYDILLLGSLDNGIRIADHEYFFRQDQKMSGSGIWEHKGGIIACLAALQSLRFMRMLRKIKIGLLLTTDNSLQGKSAKKIIRQKSRSATHVMGLHGGDLNGSLITSRSGSAFYTCNMHLKKTDDANMVSVAASVFSKLINSWCELSMDDQSLVIAPYKTSMNTNIMQPYAHGEVQLSVRYNHKEQFSQVEQKLKKLIPRKKFADSIHFQMDGGMSRDPLIENHRSKQFFEMIQTLSRNMDVRVTKEHRWSSSDICFSDPSLPTIDGFGPIGRKTQDRSEFILRHSLLERALLMAITLKEITKI